MWKQALACGSALVMLLAVTGCVTGGSGQGAGAAPALYTCLRASGPITIDGKLDEAAWARANVIETFYPLDPASEPPTSPTKVRLLWDAKNLYVAYECGDNDIWSFSDEDDDELWNGDVAELFIKPSEDALKYFEFVIAPSGAIADGRYPSRGSGTFHRFKGWSSKAAIGITIDGTDNNYTDEDKGYVVEVAIPLDSFEDAPKPAPGVKWRFGAFRYDYSKSFEDPVMMMNIPESLHHGYHYYEGYAPLVFK